LAFDGFFFNSSSGFVPHEQWTFQSIEFGNGLKLNANQIADRVGQDFYGFTMASWTRVTDPFGNLLQYYWYDEYGNLFQVQGPAPDIAKGVSNFGAHRAEDYHFNNPGHDRVWGSGGTFAGGGGNGCECSGLRAGGAGAMDGEGIGAAMRGTGQS
jgi:hypothetical protein